MTHCPTGYESILLGNYLLAVVQSSATTTGSLSLGTTETAPAAGGATRPASCARVRDTSPAGPVCPPF